MRYIKVGEFARVEARAISAVAAIKNGDNYTVTVTAAYPSVYSVYAILSKDELADLFALLDAVQ